LMSTTPHVWRPTGLNGTECKVCRGLIITNGYHCIVCSFPVHKKCMLSENVRSCADVTPQDLESRTKLSGQLEKKPPKMKFGPRAAVSSTSWQTRWFVLTTDCTLFYFKNLRSLAPSGVISLVTYTQVLVEPKHIIRLINSENANIREYVFRAETDEIQVQWANSLRESLEIAKHGVAEISATIHQASIDKRRTVNLKTFRSLKIRVGEARNLPALDITGSADPYCIITCEYGYERTMTMWNNLNPIWDEDYEFEIRNPNTAACRVILCDEDILTDDMIGEVVVPVRTVQGPKPLDKWFPISPPRGSLVTGHIHLKFIRSTTELTVQLIKCKNLAAQDPNGLSDPYVRMNYGGCKHKSKTIKKTLNPYFGEEFVFPIIPDAHILEVSVWDWDRIGNDDFLGVLDLDLRKFPVDTWINQSFLLQTRESGSRNNEQTLGEIRLRLTYMEQQILPLTGYLSLLGCLMQKKIPLIKLVAPIIEDKSGFAKTMIRVFDSNRACVRLVMDLIAGEINETNDPSIIFRGNTVVTKAMDFFMKYAGKDYLAWAVGPILTDINSQRISCEVDPSKAQKTDNISKNVKVLSKYCQMLLDRIFESAERCPIVMKISFGFIRFMVTKKYQPSQIEIVKYTSISAFVFLRFFCTAIQNPKIAGIVRKLTILSIVKCKCKIFNVILAQLSPIASRTFTLAAKIIQNLANLVNFGEKEPYMKDFNQLIVDNMDRMKAFLDELASCKEKRALKIGITQDLWLEKELATAANYLFQVNDKLKQSPGLNNPHVRELQSVLNSLNNPASFA